MRLTLYEDLPLRIFLESHARRGGKVGRDLVVVIEGTKSTREVHIACGIAERVLKGMPVDINVERIDVKLDEDSTTQVHRAQRKRFQRVAHENL